MFKNLFMINKKDKLKPKVQRYTFFVKSSIIDIWQGPKYTSDPSLYLLV